MAFSQTAGYVPVDIATIMADIMANINTQFGTTYTVDTFNGTNYYKYFYALAQRVQNGEIKTAEIFEVLQQYFEVTNEKISRPVVTNPGLIDKFLAEGYVASVKPMIDADAGKINICVDADDGDRAQGSFTITSYANLVSGTDDSVTVGATVFTAQVGAATPGTATFQAATSNNATAISLAAQINSHATAGALVSARVSGANVILTARVGGVSGNAIALAYTDNDTNIGATKSGTALTGGADNAGYAAIKLAICNIIKASTVAGGVTQGSQSETIVLSNGQSFDFKFHLPDRIPIKLKLTLTLSENNQVVVGNPDDTKTALLANINSKYQLGKNFEPQRYFTVVDAPWAAAILLQWSIDDGANWNSTIFNAEFNELFTYGLADVELVEA